MIAAAHGGQAVEVGGNGRARLVQRAAHPDGAGIVDPFVIGALLGVVHRAADHLLDEARVLVVRISGAQLGGCGQGGAHGRSLAAAAGRASKPISLTDVGT